MQTSYLSAVNMEAGSRRAFVDNSSAKTVQTKHFAKKTISQPSKCLDERHYITKAEMRSKTTTENTNWAVSVYDVW